MHYKFKICVCVCVYLGDVVKVAQDAVLFGLEFGLKVRSDDGDVVNDQLQTPRHQS